MRQWSEDDPKAALMARKREAIVAAATAAFLVEGYAGSSVNRIAADAGVSIKTLYRHFENKDDLFTAVIAHACAQGEVDTRTPPWLELPPLKALTEAGVAQLRFALSSPQLGLYRVVTRDAPRFPVLGQIYREHVRGGRNDVFRRSLAAWPPITRSHVTDPDRAADVFFALLQSEELTAALHTDALPDDARIRRRAEEAAQDLLALVAASRL